MVFLQTDLDALSGLSQGRVEHCKSAINLHTITVHATRAYDMTHHDRWWVIWTLQAVKIYEQMQMWVAPKAMYMYIALIRRLDKRPFDRFAADSPKIISNFLLSPGKLWTLHAGHYYPLNCFQVRTHILENIARYDTKHVNPFKIFRRNSAIGQILGFDRYEGVCWPSI